MFVRTCFFFDEIWTHLNMRHISNYCDQKTNYRDCDHSRRCLRAQSCLCIHEPVNNITHKRTFTNVEQYRVHFVTIFYVNYTNWKTQDQNVCSLNVDLQIKINIFVQHSIHLLRLFSLWIVFSICRLYFYFLTWTWFPPSIIQRWNIEFMHTLWWQTVRFK